MPKKWKRRYKELDLRYHKMCDTNARNFARVEVLEKENKSLFAGALEIERKLTEERDEIKIQLDKRNAEYDAVLKDAEATADINANLLLAKVRLEKEIAKLKKRK